ncbi:PAS domain-containing sensor histidine kinase [Flavobacterium agrisoli]|uniref:histidine kinase n=1 Tax=Flavobacterium agrisoli TaxID=2793066 RepID=A0A934PJ87_9FLAO|nr:PAS domain-containing sensor histidine kinase [Flavobacterium agrisoli]MBK0368394.1 PAS domain S-box protein [Flavobacterium agrisoli]
MLKDTPDKKNQNKEFIYNFEEFFESTPDLLCVAGYDGYFKRINPAVVSLLEYTEEELFARPINDFIFEADKNLTSSVRKKLTENVGLFNFENRYVTKTGKIVWLHWTSVPVEDKKIVYAIAKNITSKKTMEFERKEHIKELTQHNEELQKITYSTAHDLQSPINNLLSVFDLIEYNKIQDEESLEYLKIIELTTQQLKKTLNETVIALDKKHQENNALEEVFFNEVLEEVLNSIISLVQNSKTVLITNFDGLPSIFYNKAALKSIILNLITNAIKYNKKGTKPEITIQSLENSNGIKQLIISDKGIGFDMKKVKDKVFGLHQTFNSNDDSTGIGLYLVHKHVTNLGGTISLESQINQGATFTITFKNTIL